MTRRKIKVRPPHPNNKHREPIAGLAASINPKSMTAARVPEKLTADDGTVEYVDLTQLAEAGQRNLVTLAMAVDGKQGEWGKITVAAWQRADGTFEIRNGIRSADRTAYGWLKRCGT